MKKLAVVITTLVVALFPVAAAHAQTRSVADPRDTNIPATADILKLSVANGATTFRATVTLRSAVPNRSSAYVLFQNVATKARFVVGNESSGHSHDRIFKNVARGGATADVACRKLSVVVDRTRDQVRISFPQRCLGDDAGKVRASALTEEPGNGADQDQTTRTLVVRRG